MRHRVSVPADTGQHADNPLLLGQAVTKPPPPARPTVTEASESPRPPTEDAVLPVDPDLKPIQPVIAHQEPSPDVARLIARHRARRQRRQRILISIIGGILLVAMTIGYIVFTSLADKSASDDKDAASEGQSTERNALTFDGAVVQSSRLSAVSWDEVDLNADMTFDDSPVTVGSSRLTDGSDGRVVYRANLQVRGYHIIEQATLHVMLVDTHNRIYAQYDLPLTLLRPGAQARSVTVAVPTVLVRRAEKVMAHVTVEREMSGAMMFDEILYKPIRSSSFSAMQITAFNPTAAPMQGAIFHIRAFNAAHETVARWTVRWKHPIQGRQRVEFAALTPVKPQWKIAAWEVIGAGVTTPSPGISPGTSPGSTPKEAFGAGDKQAP